MSSSSLTQLPISCCWLLLLVGHVFTQDATIRYSISEETDPSTFIGSVAIDSKLFNNISNERLKVLNFQILKEGNKDVDKFRIEKDTSLLWTSETIDREEFSECFATCEIEFNVAVFDLEKSDFIFIIKVVVNILDFNDNSPEFTNINNPVTISENAPVGSLIVSGAAIDLDQGMDNSLQTYTLLDDNDLFELKTVQVNDYDKEFELFLSRGLDREEKMSYSLTILAKDGGNPQRTGTLSLVIIVTDYNDNVPEFDQQLFNTSVDENIPIQTNILTIQAFDEDFGENGRVSYKFSNRVGDRILNLFSIDEYSGNLTTAGNIDFETDEEFSFEVVAFDHGDPKLSSSVSVHITVNDLNDNAPTINLNQPPGGTVISEQSDVGSFVTHLEIIDLDSGKNGEIRCNLSDSHFRIASVSIENNYKIVLNETLDHDILANHNVTILCQDLGDKPLFSVAYFTVHVEDINDNSPKFTENVYTVSVYENIANGTSLLAVSAHDGDSGNYGQVEYSLYNDTEHLFKIHSFTGVIRTNVTLDREIHGDQVFLRVLAKDKGEPPLISTATVVVNIKDLNDNAPKFDKDPIKFYVLENLDAGTLVGNLSGYDPDEGVNGTFVYQFPTNPEVLEYFRFNDLGQIFTTKSLDREKQDMHEFEVEAIDKGGLRSSVSVVIEVTDVNDNYPEIIYPNEYDNSISIPYTFAVSSEVVQIEARDYDTGVNAELYYHIDQDNASYAFVLEASSGRFLLNRSLHFANIGQVFFFRIRVKDGGQEPLSTFMEFNVVVTEDHYGKARQAEQTRNLWIVVGIVLVTAILSVIMIIVIVKICWCGRRKSGTGSTSDIMEDSDLDPRYLDSLSATSNSSKDSNCNVKVKDVIAIPNEKEYYSKADEAGYGKTTLDQQTAYIEQLKALEVHKKLDESVSDNSCELGTRDSGQGSSDHDNSSLQELHNINNTASNSPGQMNRGSNYYPYDRSQHLPSNHFHDNHLPNNHHHNDYHHSNSEYNNNSHNNHQLNNSSYSNSFYGNNQGDNTSDCVIMLKSAVSFSHTPTKTAEKREIGKLKRGNKKVMFSFDLENSHDSQRSSTVSSQSIGDINYTLSDPSSSRRLNRMVSEDSAIELPDRLSRSWGSGSNSWLRRSADNLKLQENCDKHNQLPSNQIRFGTGKSSQASPMGSNIKGYLDKVMGRTRHSSLSESQEQVSDFNSRAYSYNKDSEHTSQSGPNDVFMLSKNYYPSTTSRETDSTTCGSYHLGSSSNSYSRGGSFTLQKPFTGSLSIDSDNVFADDIEV